MSPRPPLKSTGVRAANEKHLLKIIRERGIVTQAELAADTGLQASTIFRIFRGLEQRGTIRQIDPVEPRESRQGRRPAFFELNPRAAYSVGIDLVHSGIAVLLVDFKGTPVREHESVFPEVFAAQDVLDLIIREVRQILDTEGVTAEQLIGIGVGAPGVVDIENGTVVRYSRFPGMEGLPLREAIGEAVDVPVFVQNNASVITLAECRFGRGRQLKSMVAYLLRSGVGGAFLQNGHIYTSQGMSAFEIGHTVLAASPGNPGEAATLEDLMSEDALLRTVRDAGLEISDLNELSDCISSGDSPVCDALENVSRMFIRHAKNLALLLNPQALMIVSRHRPVAEYFASKLIESLDANRTTDRFNVLRVIPLQYDPILACRGAADLVFDHYFS